MARRYDASSINVATDVEGIRSNVGMYLGDTDHVAAEQCAKEILHNATDEMIELGGGLIRMTIAALRTGGHLVTVADTGRGIPVERHPKTGVSTMETVLTKLHAGGKNAGKSAYGKRTFGVHGVGAAVVNACSVRMLAWSHRHGRWNHMAFTRGVRVAADAKTPPPFAWKRGTIIQYELDRDVLPEDVLLENVQKICALARFWAPITIQYRDPSRAATLRPRPPTILLDSMRARRDVAILAGPIIINDDGVRAVIAWTDATTVSDVAASVAGAPVPSGTHVQGLQEAVTAALRRAGRSKTLDGTIGLLAALDVSVDRPSFGGQNKTSLKTAETRRRVAEALERPLAKYLRANGEQTRAVVEHAEAIGSINERADEQRELARGASRAKTTRHALPLGFKSATQFPAHQRELFLLEGKSALGSAMNGKEKWQEVLPLQGKLPNLVKRESLRNNPFVNNIINVTGYDSRNPDRPLRVGKIVLLCDADDDGDHIRVLLLTVLHRVMPGVLRRNLVYTVDAPLYEAMTPRGEQVTGDTLRDMRREHGTLRNANRMKGWGGCEAPLLNTIAFNPATRRWIRIDPPTLKEEEAFEALLGKDSAERKKMAGAAGAAEIE